MPLLDAALAFAITMLAVATVVTKIVELLPKLFLNRAAEFDRMLRDFGDNELKKIVERVSGTSPGVAKAVSDNAIQTIKTEVDGTHLSNSDLIDGLKQTALGKQLLAAPDASEIFDEISRRYAAVEQQFSEVFRKDARKVAMGVAFVLAVAFNIDSINILGSYISNPSLSAATAARSDSAMADYTANLSKLKDENKNEELLKQFVESQKELQTELDRLNSGVFPFGWSYFPYGPNPPKPWSRTDPGFQTDPWWKAWRVWGGWAIGVCFTAALAGLGAPFWFDVVRNITQLVQAGSTSAPAPAAASPAAAAPTPVAPTPVAPTVVAPTPVAPTTNAPPAAGE